MERVIYSESMFIDSGAHSLYNLEVLGHKKRKGEHGRELDRPPVRWSQGDFSFYNLHKGTPFRKYCDRYANFMKAMAGKGLLLANIDAISNPELTWEVQQFFEKEHGVQPVPIIHYGTPMKWVDKYVWKSNNRYDLLGVGGLGQGVSRHEYFQWADLFFSHICPKADGYLPAIKTHGFAMTSWELMCRYPWYCMTDDHEVLTKNGWKGRSEILVGEDVLAYNEDGTSEWSSVIELPEFSVENEEMYHLSNRNFEAFVTPNHRWPVFSDHGRRRQVLKFSWKTTEEILPPKDFKIPRKARYKDFPKKEKFSDEVIELLAWFWTDGTHGVSNPGFPCEKRCVVIYQSEKANPDKVIEIRSLLLRTKDVWYESKIKADPGMVSFEVNGPIANEVIRLAPQKNKDIPLSFILALTERQLRLFVDTSLKGDGTKNIRLVREEGFEIRQLNGRNLEIFRVAAMMLGYSTSVQKSSEYAPGKRIDLLRTSSVGSIYSAHLHVQKFKHTGKIWCLRVKSGAFFTRCRGHVYVTGNSVDSATWVKLSAYGWLYIPRWSKEKGWRFDKPPIMLNFSSKSPRKEERQKHYDNCLPEVRKTADRWLEHLDLEMGSVILKKGKEEMVEFGVASHHRARSVANLRYLTMLQDSRPKWPHPLDPEVVEHRGVKYSKGFGI